MKPTVFQLFVGSILGLEFAVSCHAAEATTNEANLMMHTFRREESRRLDATFLDGIPGRFQWEAQRPELRQQYFEMLGLWPLPERTPLEAQVTGVLERQEGFRVEKLH